MKKNGIYEGLVVGLSTEGEGIIKEEGTTVFVPFCLTGERVRYKVLKVKGNIAYGKLESVETEAYSRTKPPCPVFYKCGGCDIQHMSYPAQLEYKRGVVASALKKIGGIDFEVSETVPCDKEWRYRNKLALPIGGDGGAVECGFYAPRSHRIVPVTDCNIQAEWVQKVIEAVKKFAVARHICAFDEQTRTGILRRIVVREIQGKYVFALVVAKDINVDFLIAELEKSFKDFTFLININGSDGNAIFSDNWRICRGQGYINAEDMGIKFRAGANTFVQVNDGVRQKLYSAVLAEADENAVAIDLYSGGGMLTAMLAKKCGTAYGIEIVPEASRCADELKEANGLEGKMFNICGAVEDEVAKILKATEKKERVVVCDPPRKGMERSVVKALLSAWVDKVVLVSCNPATLARDLGILTGTLKEVDGALVKVPPSRQGAYIIKKVIPFDMFPQTKHVETMVMLIHRKHWWYR